MDIICPKCDFKRTVPDEKVPPTAEMATCPKCSNKFRFRTLTPQAKEPAAPPPASEQTAPAQQQPPSAQQQPPAPPLPYEEEPPQPMPGSDTSARQQRGDVFSGLEALGEKSQEDGYSPAEPRGHSRRPSRGRVYEDAYEAEEQEVPWERLDQYGFFPGLFATIKRAMLSPQQFFASMPIGNGFIRPLAFYVLLSMISAIAQFLFQMLGLTVISGMSGAGSEAGIPDAYAFMGMGAASAFVLLLYPIVFTIGIYVTAAVHHLFLMLFQAASAGFEGTFRALAYGSAPTVLTMVPILGWIVASVWMLVVTFIGLKTIHRTSYARVLTAFCAMFFTFVLLIGFLAYLIHSMATAFTQ